MNVKIEVTVYRDQDICFQIEDLIAQLKLGGRFLPHFSAGLLWSASTPVDVCCDRSHSTPKGAKAQKPSAKAG